MSSPMSSPMTSNDTLRLKIIAFLLRYPDHELIHVLPRIEAIVNDISDADDRKMWSRFFSAISAPLLDLQETYTATFDLNPDASLNLTYHLCGDGENRGRMLARIKEAYETSGYRTTTTDLPDYLPMMLEFISERPELRDFGLFRECFGALDVLAERLETMGSPYAGLMRWAGKYLSPPRTPDEGAVSEVQLRSLWRAEHVGLHSPAEAGSEMEGGMRCT